MNKEFSEFLDYIWNSGAEKYFTNLRRLRLFANKISYSLQIISGEVNFEDFLALELIRDIHPPLYDVIFRNGPNYFYDPAMAFETWGERKYWLDDERATKARLEFYESLRKSVPEDKHYVFSLVAGLFPLYAEATNQGSWRKLTDLEAEKERRIWHPRFFSQYFLFKVPPQLFSQKAFQTFLRSVKSADEESARREFNRLFTSMLNEDFKRWHFMHQIDMAFTDIGFAAKRGLCTGMTENAKHWTADAFEFIIALRCLRGTLTEMTIEDERQEFIQTIIQKTSSELYAMYVVSWIPEDSPDWLRTTLAKAKPFLRNYLRSHYLIQNPPSVFDQFQGGPSAQNIDPNQFQFAWRQLGEGADGDQRQYLRTLFNVKPESIDKFLNLMFRVPFMDDYTALKPLFDYEELSKLIATNEHKLDPEKVRQFRERFEAEQRSGHGDHPDNLNQ